MKIIALCLGVLLWVSAKTQLIQYSPSTVIFKSVTGSYYNTDYIYFTNQSQESIQLEYTLIQEQGVQGWHQALCTHLGCYDFVPKYGSLGSLAPGEMGYLAFTVATNSTVGNGIYKFRIASLNVEDTITFSYEILDSDAFIEQPWATIKLETEMIGCFFKNQNLENKVAIYHISGKRIDVQEVNGIYSFSLDNLPAGVYLITASDNQGRRLTHKFILP